VSSIEGDELVDCFDIALFAAARYYYANHDAGCIPSLRVIALPLEHKLVLDGEAGVQGHIKLLHFMGEYIGVKRVANIARGDGLKGIFAQFSCMTSQAQKRQESLCTIKVWTPRFIRDCLVFGILKKTVEAVSEIRWSQMQVSLTLGKATTLSSLSDGIS